MLMEFLRNLAMGAIADEVRKTPQGKDIQEEYVAPVANRLMDAIIPPAAASGADAIDTSRQDQLDALIAAENRMQPQPTANPLPQMQMPAPANPSGEIVSLEDMTRRPVVQQAYPSSLSDVQMPPTAEERAMQTQDFVRQNTVPEKLSEQQAAAKVTETAKRLQAEAPDAKEDEVIAAAVVEEGKNDPSFFDALGGKIGDFFGSEKNMLGLALAFNSLRYQPDQGLAAVLGKRLETISTESKQNRTAQALLKGKDPKQQAIGKMMLAGVSYKDALAMSKETDFDKKWRLAGSDLEKYNKYFGSKGTTVTVGGAGSKGLEEVDKTFGKDWSAWTQGGAASVRKNLGTLRTVIDSIKEGKNLSGTLIGLAPDQGLNLFAPEAKAARDRVAGVVQQSLKETLGAQFTEKEAAQLIQRAYDPALDETENLARLEALALMIESAAKAKQEAMDYFGKDFTMLGFKQTEMPTAQDFYDAMDQAASRITPFRQGESTKTGTVKTFTTADGKTANYSKVKEGPDSDPSTWKKVD
jgi:hypothetical protein